MAREWTRKEIEAELGINRGSLDHLGNGKNGVNLVPYTRKDEHGWKLYDDKAVEKLRKIQILLACGMKLDKIAELMKKSDAEIAEVIRDQIPVLEEKRDSLNNIILLAHNMSEISFRAYISGVFGKFDPSAITSIMKKAGDELAFFHSKVDEVFSKINDLDEEGMNTLCNSFRSALNMYHTVFSNNHATYADEEKAYQSVKEFIKHFLFPCKDMDVFLVMNSGLVQDFTDMVVGKDCAQFIRQQMTRHYTDILTSSENYLTESVNTINKFFKYYLELRMEEHGIQQPYPPLREVLVLVDPSELWPQKIIQLLSKILENFSLFLDINTVLVMIKSTLLNTDSSVWMEVGLPASGDDQIAVIEFLQKASAIYMDKRFGKGEEENDINRLGLLRSDKNS